MPLPSPPPRAANSPNICRKPSRQPPTRSSSGHCSTIPTGWASNSAHRSTTGTAPAAAPTESSTASTTTAERSPSSTWPIAETPTVHDSRSAGQTVTDERAWTPCGRTLCPPGSPEADTKESVSAPGRRAPSSTAHRRHRRPRRRAHARAPRRSRPLRAAPPVRRGSAKTRNQQHLASLPGEEVDRLVDLAERQTVGDQPLGVESSATAGELTAPFYDLVAGRHRQSATLLGLGGLGDVERIPARPTTGHAACRSPRGRTRARGAPGRGWRQPLQQITGRDHPARDLRLVQRAASHHERYPRGQRGQHSAPAAVGHHHRSPRQQPVVGQECRLNG